MEFQQEDNSKKGRFFLEEDTSKETEITYTYFAPNKIIVDHTSVSNELQGKNVGKQLVERVVAFARDNDIKILPLCPFAKAVLTKNTDFSDVLIRG